MFDFASILPDNRTQLELTLEQAIAETGPDLSPIATLMNPDTCPVNLLGWLAWAFSVDLWDDIWSEPVKRQVIKNSIAVHRKKGTPGSIKRAFSALNLDILFSEWFEHQGVSHTFVAGFDADNIFAAGFQFDQAFVDLLIRQIENLKPVRSHYSIEFSETIQTPISVRSGVLAAQENNDCFAPRVASHTQEMTCFVSCGVAASHIATQTLVFTGAPA